MNNNEAAQTIAYSALTGTTEVGAICPCGEYKGMNDCPDEECGDVFCIFCEDGCPSCGKAIDFSA